eukprot:symbB.v1.2.035782.t1/scaffold4901.1/size52642/1
MGYPCATPCVAETSTWLNRRRSELRVSRLTRLRGCQWMPPMR